MKIAQVTPFFYPVMGGLETHVLNLSRWLVKRGHDVTVLTSNRSRRGIITCRQESVDGILIKRFPIAVEVSEFAKLWPGFLRDLWNGAFDVIHVHNYRHFHCDLSLMASKLSRAVCVLTTHAPYFYDKIRPFSTRLLSKIYDDSFGRISLRSYARIIALTETEIPWLTDHGARSKEIRVIPNGVTFEVLEQGNAEKFRKKHKLDGPIILGVGRVHHSKGFQFLLATLPKILKELSNVTIVIVGPDAGYLPELKTIAQQLRIEERVIFTGVLFEEELRDAYAACSLFVLSSICEGFGIVLIEAMAQRKPVIATRSGGPSSLVVNGINGYLVDYGDTDKLADLIINVLRHKNLALSLGMRGREYAQQYTWDRIAAKVESTYFEALKSTRLKAHENSSS